MFRCRRDFDVSSRDVGRLGSLTHDVTMLAVGLDISSMKSVD